VDERRGGGASFKVFLADVTVASTNGTGPAGRTLPDEPAEETDLAAGAAPAPVPSAGTLG